MSAQVAADLRAAADVLERDGWTRYRPHCEGGHCAAGAIEVVVDPEWRTANRWLGDQKARFGQDIRALSDYVGDEVTAWNDAPGRTADEVIAALRAAADRAEADQ